MSFLRKFSNLIFSLVMLHGCGAALVIRLPALSVAAQCDSSGTPFGGGSGTALAPYLICTDVHLGNIGTAASSSFLQTAEIDLVGSSFTPISTDFTGTYNGQNFAIKNFTFSPPLGLGIDVGIFRTSTGATFRNIVIQNVFFDANGANSLGGVVGHALNSTFDQIVVTGTFRDLTSSGVAGGSGGVAGIVEAGTFSNITATLSLQTWSTNFTGGVAGQAVDISLSSSVGSVSADVGSGLNNTGGLVGLLSRNTGTCLIASSAGSLTTIPGTYSVIVGGVAGQVSSNCTIDRSHASVSIDNPWLAGGISGDMSGTITRSYATGVISDPLGSGALGGLVGVSIGGTISNSYSLVDVLSANNWIGGLVGEVNGISITNSYAVGVVTAGAASVGGLLGGSTGAAPVITNSFWDTQTTGQATSVGGGTGKTTIQMQTGATFTGWDFTSIWQISPGQYPTLR